MYCNNLIIFICVPAKTGFAIENFHKRLCNFDVDQDKAINNLVIYSRYVKVTTKVDGINLVELLSTDTMTIELSRYLA